MLCPSPLWVRALVASFLVSCSAPSRGEEPSSTSGVPTEAFDVVEGPILLHAAIELQWGGQSFDYVLEGERGIFWAAKAYTEESKTGEGSPAIVGQFPKPGSPLEMGLAAIDFEGDGPTRVDQPQLLRTPDGFLHVFVGYREHESGFGRIRYLRSRRPENIRELVDRSELLPPGAYGNCHNRQNVAITRDGARAVLAVLTTNEPGKTWMNTPLVFLGRRDGLDLRFDPPIRYADPMPFFYPLVAATDEGIVMLGSVPTDDDSARNAKLVHLDWEGRRLHMEDLPAPPGPGHSFAHDLRPLDADDWTILGISRTIAPKEGTVRSIEFWTYDARRRELRRRRELVRDHAKDESITNAGDLLVLRGRPPMFVNNPHSGGLRLWKGDLFGEGVLDLVVLARTEPRDLGYAGTRSVFVPNLLHGSVISSRTAYIAADLSNVDKQEGARGPCSLLLWRIGLPD